MIKHIHVDDYHLEPYIIENTAIIFIALEHGGGKFLISRELFLSLVNSSEYNYRPNKPEIVIIPLQNGVITYHIYMLSSLIYDITHDLTISAIED